MSEAAKNEKRPQDPLALVALGLALLFFCVGYYRLGHPIELVWDEKSYVPAAHAMVSSGTIQETTHPPLGKFLIALAIALAGDEPTSFRLPGLIAGSAIVLLIFLIGRSLSGSSLAGVLAAFAAATDTLSFVQARTAIFGSTMLAFMLLSLYATVRWSQTWRRGWLFLSAVAFGAACATRWVGFSIILPIALVPLLVRPAGSSRRAMVGAGSVFLAVALVVYSALFLVGPLSRGEPLTALFSLHASMFQVHWSSLLVSHRYTSPWWSWPLMQRPVWYGFELYPQIGADGSRIAEGILCLGNPLLFLSFPLFVVIGIWRAWKLRSQYQMIVLAAAFSQWLQWSWVPTNTYFHYFYTVVPFLTLSMGETLSSFLKKGGWRWMLVVLFYGGLIACFIYWYPLLTGALITMTSAIQHVWFKSWW